METTTSINNNTIAKVGEVAAIKTAVRTGYIDMVRLIMTILVIAVHAAVTYGSIGDWTYEDPAQNELTGIILSFVVFYSQAFFMALFFFFSGYFTPGSVDRKGWGGFWKDRVLRIGIPLVAYTWFLSLVPNFIDAVGNYGYSGTFWQFSIQNFHSDADEGPTWFLFAVLLFSVVYFIVRYLIGENKLKSDWVNKIPAPGILSLISGATFISIGMFLVSQFMSIDSAVDVFDIFSLKLAFFPSYIVFFIAGILAFRSKWIDEFSPKVINFWNWMSAALVIVLPAFMILGGAADGYIDQYMTGLNWRCLVTCLWFGFACVSFSISITFWMKNRTVANSRLAAIGSKDNFAVYIIHPLILVPISYMLSFTQMAPMIKFIVNMAITVPICYLAAEILRRLPGLKRIL